MPETAAQAALPGVLAEIAALAGHDAACRLALALGGRSLYIPRPDRLHDRHPLVEAIGFRAARGIAGRFNGENIEIPLARRALAQNLAASGLTVAQVAARLQISVKVARRYIKSFPGTMVP